jgi:serine/threonine protein kinase
MLEQGPLSGQQLAGKYQMGGLLGQGGFGAVYRAQHVLLNRPQAIKILLEQHFTSPKFRERFTREAQVLARLDHPNIVHVDDFGIEGNRAYLVMPYIGGGTLQGILKARRGPLGLNDTWRYLEYICAALDYAHQRSIAHLDLKPLNLLIHEDGRLLLSDFGLAHLMEQGSVEGGTSLSFGTPSYMAPEHFDGQPEQRSDVYALGVILYQMLSGRLPFEGSTPRAIMHKLLTEPPAPLRATRPELPPALDDVLGQALAKDPEQRYQMAGELLADFKAAMAGRQTQAFSSGASLANAPTRLSQPPQGTTIRATNPPGASIPPTIHTSSDVAFTPSGSPAPAATPSTPSTSSTPGSGGASNEQILRELEELKAAMRQMAQQTPAPAGRPPASGPMPPPIFGQPVMPVYGPPAMARPVPRTTKVWSPGFIWLFVLLALVGGGASVLLLRDALPSLLLQAALVVICLTGVFFTRSKLIRTGLLLQVLAAVLMIPFPFYRFLYFYDVRFYSPLYSFQPAGYLLVAIVSSMSLLCISYGIARWRVSPDLGLLILQIILSLGVVILLFHGVFVSFFTAFFVLQAFSTLVFLLRPACWKQRPVITLLFVLGGIISTLAVYSYLPFIFFAAAPVFSLLAFLLLVRTEQVMKRKQQQAALAG